MSDAKAIENSYHMQIMEGDIIRTIRDYHQYFGHYHTGGVPGRNELDETQGAAVADHLPSNCKYGFPGLRRARVRAHTRSADLASRGGGPVRRVNTS